jgi:signal transduction histidine kinase
MTESRPARLPVAAPNVAPPPPFTERRVAYRRAADQLAHEETRLLARSLDVLAARGDAEARLAGLLDLLAETVGAVRAAVVADGADRRVAVAADGDADRAPALELAAWLDAAAPMTRARRAAAGPAAVSVAIRAAGGGSGRGGTRAKAGRRRGPTSGSTPKPAPALSFACLPIPSAGDVTLGFAFRRPVAATTLAQRLPPAMARHAAVALSLVTESLATERALAALRAGESERDRFVSTVAHELRTPLTGLSGYLDLILDGRVEDRAIEREFMERGRTIVGSMSALVGDLLELSRLESGTLALDIRPFSLAEAITAVHGGLMPIALERGLDLRIVAPPRLRAASGDRRRVEQVLTNLAANALKFGGPPGRVVELAGWFDGTVALVAVRDEGDGIEDEDRARIFERFYRMAGHERVTGTGLGLPIARDLARSMGGDLDVASQQGAGSSFVLVLPGPGAVVSPVAIATALAATLSAESERLRTIAILRAAGPSSDMDAGPVDPLAKPVGAAADGADAAEAAAATHPGRGGTPKGGHLRLRPSVHAAAR